MPRGAPCTLLLVAVLFAILLFVAPLLFLGIVGGAFSRLGFSSLQILLLLGITLVGSFVNIPVARIRSELPYGEVVQLPRGFLVGRLYRIPSFVTETTIAVNLGGAVVPSLVSFVLVVAAVGMGGAGILVPIGLGVLGVALVTRLVARPVPGLGITTPFFVPPIGAAIAGTLLAFGIPWAGPVIGYVSGTLGTLIGADLLLWREFPRLGARVVSIGGAGTFDGIFLAGIIAALLA
ncbi:MAG: DUF1614 domain-containing protein [Methanospirillum sp.]